MRAVAGTMSKEMMEAELFQCKINAKLLQQARCASSCMFLSSMVKIDLCNPGKEAARKHTEVTRGQSGHKKGPPHPQIWRATVKKLITEAEAKPELENSEALKELKNYRDRYQADPTQHMYFVKQV